MTTLTRQPFAPLDGARLQTLTSIKNRQNAPSPAASKRKASELTPDDFENVDPILFAKRPKGTDASPFSIPRDTLKPSSIFLTTQKPAKVASVTPPAPLRSLPVSPRSRNPKSPISRLNTSAPRASPLSTPAGRSPTRSGRAGILSRRRTAGPGSYSRVDPPSFGASAVPFSLDAALKGTIPSYASRGPSTTTNAAPSVTIPSAVADEIPAPAVDAFPAPEMKASWFFDIHEDTPDQEMTNLLQHGTCILDISSDEDSPFSSSRIARDGRDKENVPPPDDVSQTSRAVARNEGEMVVEKERFALGDLAVEEYYAAGCDASSVILIPEEEEEKETLVESRSPLTVVPEVEAEVAEVQEQAPEPEVVEKLEEPLAEPAEVPAVEDASVVAEEVLVTEDVEVLLARDDAPTCAAVLEPMEGTGEAFELWESGSARDAGSPAPIEE
ncbi:uncharacterized protein DNG_09549 [Cephalotrichum gorgonifer]|uniref:Thymidylate kinase n=1 Tax=Cephalotrichum gorgonifer TaxID=2041049 RepID=A0AAE8SZE1_9PEZI|nr:uncharacterized protein DNG_09549 [Cephalotrichum gorgonifer]